MCPQTPRHFDDRGTSHLFQTQSSGRARKMRKNIINVAVFALCLFESPVCASSGYIIECNPQFFYPKKKINRALEYFSEQSSAGVTADNPKDCRGYECGMWETYCTTAYCKEALELRMCAWGRPITLPWRDVGGALEAVMSHCNYKAGSAWSTKGYYFTIQDNNGRECGGDPTPLIDPVDPNTQE
ncbi:hypothetical protein Dda_4844 [Drechslerella dactyloides]|uniref:Uncharacterized protein n=1 Tax=Drechslerella dactyloides TaxID=74499 RepID=A0AAD6NKZ7_DREDA|nr:hypothetical protein Dda_4844 [Drechslerella dactyloides]